MAELHKKVKSTLQDVTLTWYKREFDKWLNDFKETDAYADIVDGYEECWSEIYKELHRRFKENIWNPIKLANGCNEEGTFYWWRPNPAKNGFKNDVSTNQDHQRRSSED